MPAIERVIPLVGHLPSSIREALVRRLRELMGLGLIVVAGLAAAALVAAPSATASQGCPRLQACTTWCPGDPNPAGRPIPWDTAVCHNYYWDSYGLHDVDNGAFYKWSTMGW